MARTLFFAGLFTLVAAAAWFRGGTVESPDRSAAGIEPTALQNGTMQAGEAMAPPRQMPPGNPSERAPNLDPQQTTGQASYPNPFRPGRTRDGEAGQRPQTREERAVSRSVDRMIAELEAKYPTGEDDPADHRSPEEREHDTEVVQNALTGLRQAYLTAQERENEPQTHKEE